MPVINLSNLIKPWQLMGFPPYFCSQEDDKKKEEVVSNGYVWGTSIQVSSSQWYLEISSKNCTDSAFCRDNPGRDDIRLIQWPVVTKKTTGQGWWL